VEETTFLDSEAGPGACATAPYRFGLVVMPDLLHEGLDRRAANMQELVLGGSTDSVSVQIFQRRAIAEHQRYTDVQIVGHEDSHQLMKWKLSRAARLIRLRSTLRARPLLAALVKSLHVPDPNIPLYQGNGDPNPEYDAYICTLASVVMTCPNLEVLTGFYAFYNHTFDRLTHALSTRQKLRQHVWIIAENDDVNDRGQTQLPPGLLDEEQTYQFLQYHDRWKQLDTLLLCSPGGLGIIEHEVFIRMLHSLPALRSLAISSFDKDDFHDMTLLSLPPWVTTLRLEECLGVTDRGLRKWTAKPNAFQIQRLSLIHQNITSLLTISKIFANLDRLFKFTIVQNDVIPLLPNEMRHVVVHPVLASKSLKFLHWDISSVMTSSTAESRSLVPDRSSTTPNMLLALSISNRGFPNLVRLRTPRDTSPPGILQSVCLPSEGAITLPDDSLHGFQYQRLRRSNSLRAARLRAQKIHEHNTTNLRRVPSDRQNEPVDPRDVNKLQHGQKSTSKTSTSTLGSLNTTSSNYSSTGSGDPTLGRTPVRELVSPISSDPDTFNILAPDDGIVSPIAADQDPVHSSSRDSDKQVVVGPVRRRRNENFHRESICRCTPSPTMNRDSLCLCEAHEPQDVAEASGGLAPPPRSPFRPQPLDTLADQPRTRFPSLNKIRQRRVPSLYLQPDVVGRDGNGGLIGWGDLMRISEKMQVSRDAQRAAENAMEDSETRKDKEESDGDAGGTLREGGREKMCRGSGFEHRKSGEPGPEFPTLQKILSASSSSSVGSSHEKTRSKSKSSSRLSLSLLRSGEKEMTARQVPATHIARPRGDRGGDVEPQDFF
jgi:hypothetical protein